MFRWNEDATKSKYFGQGRYSYLIRMVFFGELAELKEKVEETKDKRWSGHRVSKQLEEMDEARERRKREVEDADEVLNVSNTVAFGFFCKQITQGGKSQKFCFFVRVRQQQVGQTGRPKACRPYRQQLR